MRDCNTGSSPVRWSTTLSEEPAARMRDCNMSSFHAADLILGRKSLQPECGIATSSGMPVPVSRRSSRKSLQHECGIATLPVNDNVNKQRSSEEPAARMRDCNRVMLLSLATVYL